MGCCCRFDLHSPAQVRRTPRYVRTASVSGADVHIYSYSATHRCTDGHANSGSGFNNATPTPVDTDTPQPLIVDTEIPSATPTPSPKVPTATPTITPAPNYGNGDASALIDGHLDIGWLTSRIHGGFATIGFQGNALESVTGFVVDCAATGSVPATADLKHFEVLFSSTSADPGAFVSGTTETCAQQTACSNSCCRPPCRPVTCSCS